MKKEKKRREMGGGVKKILTDEEGVVKNDFAVGCSVKGLKTYHCENE